MSNVTLLQSWMPGHRANAGSLLELHATLGPDCIGREEFHLRHHLAGHPLLRMDAIAELADSLPPAAVECHAAKQPVLVPGGCTDDLVRPSEVVLDIDNSQRWLVLWNIEQSPPYRKLLDDVLDEVRPLLPEREGRMGRREAFLFISAPGAVTPVHFDPENNFLLQIRGTKEVMVGRFPDQAAALVELDRYHDGGHRNLEQVPPRSSNFLMQPGDGIYLYPWAPHWVFNGDQASVSLSITFRTARSQREELVHLCNARLRRLGLSPRPAGESPLRDSVKASCIALKGWLRRGGKPWRGERDFGQA